MHRYVLAVPTMRFERLIRQRPTFSNNTVNKSPNNPFANGPIRPTTREILLPMQLYANKHNREILQTPFEDPYTAPNAQLHMSNLITQDAAQFQYTGIPNACRTSSQPSIAGNYYNSTVQLYLDSQGVHNDTNELPLVRHG